MNWDFLIKNTDSLFVTTDSRQVTPGCIFVALKGEHFDGNEFVDQAVKAGARYVIKGEHALQELQDLARAWRRELALPIIGITGTNGKTTTKELTASVLKTKYNIHYTQGNYNNSLGVPLTLLQLTRAHELAIVEMGASHPGDIKELVNIAEPNCGLITNVGRAHLLGFGSFEGVQKTKAELYDFLVAHQGQVFINQDNPYLTNMYQRSGGQAKNPIMYTTGQMPACTHLVGDYNSENIQAALCIGEYFGISREKGLEAIRAYIPTNNRSMLKQTERNTIVVDAYNANATSMAAAIQAFKGDCLILGDMLELGDYSLEEHKKIVDLIVQKAFTTVYLVGHEFAQTKQNFLCFPTADALKEHLIKEPLTGKHILLKGSRGIKLEILLDVL